MNLTYTFDNFVDGQWIVGDGPEIKTFDPAQPELRVGAYREATKELVHRAIGAAASAQKVWRVLPVGARNELLEKFIRAVEDAKDELALSIALELGKPLHEARNEIGKSCTEARYMHGPCVDEQRRPERARLARTRSDIDRASAA